MDVKEVSSWLDGIYRDFDIDSEEAEIMVMYNNFKYMDHHSYNNVEAFSKYELIFGLLELAEADDYKLDAEENDETNAYGYMYSRLQSDKAILYMTVTPLGEWELFFTEKF